MTAFVVCKDENGKHLYWKYFPVGWTEDLKDARLYAMEVSARQALHRIAKRPDGIGLRVEEV